MANEVLGILCSSGKDSLYAAFLEHSKGHELKCLITISSRNPHSFMYHTSNIHLVRLQAEALRLPLILKTTPGQKEKELDDLEGALIEAKLRFGIRGITTGALKSNYQQTRIDRICKRLSLKVFSPLWLMPQEEELHRILDSDFSVIITQVACLGLDETWLGKELTEDRIQRLVELNKKYGVNVAGEGGEYETLVIDAPFFQKKIVIKKSHVVKQDANTAQLLIERAVLQEK
jgi:asparagine synthase (glutamine-hydrolysing)